MIDPRRTLLLGRIVLLALVNGLLWAAVIPPWQTPDEPKHFEFVRLMRSGDVLAFTTEAESADPALQQEILASMDQHHFWWYGRSPGYDPEKPPERFADVWLLGGHTALARTSPVYHWLLARIQPRGLLTGLYVGRIVSILLGGLVILFAGLTARELFPDNHLIRYGTPLFLALHPMFAFAHAGVNNDPLVNALAALAFWLVARLLVRGGTLSRLLLLAIVTVAAVATKRIAVVLVPSAILAILLWRATRSRRPLLAAIGWTVAVLALVAVGAWWWAFGGGQALPQQWRWNVVQYFFNDPAQWDEIVAYLRAPGTPTVVAEWLWRIHNGFWGSFGWDLIPLPTPLYLLAALIGLIAAAGVVRRMLDRGASAPARAGLVVFGTAVVLTAAAAVAFFVAYLDLAYPVPPQGRYLYLCAVPIAVLVLAGLSAWVPERLHLRSLTVLAVTMLLFDLLALFGVVVPFFYR